MNLLKQLHGRIRGWLPSEPINFRVSVLKRANPRSYRNFRVLSRITILAMEIPLFALVYFSNLNPFVRFASILTVLSSAFMLSVLADRYAKRKYVEPPPNVREKW